MAIEDSGISSIGFGPPPAADKLFGYSGSIIVEGVVILFLYRDFGANFLGDDDDDDDGG